MLKREREEGIIYIYDGKSSTELIYFIYIYVYT
jgi:hypothetical protein